MKSFKLKFTYNASDNTILNSQSLHVNYKNIQTYWALCGLLVLNAVTASADPLNLSQYPLFIGSVNKANVLLILDNSNSMDEEPSGTTACSAPGNCGSASDKSKSQIARTAAKSLISSYTNKINMGLMAYQQNANSLYHLHNSPYDVSYNSANYNSAFSGARESTTKRYKIENPTNLGNYIYYNVALPMYSNANLGNAYCYTRSLNAIPFSDSIADNYRCFKNYTGTTDTIPPNNASEAATGYANYWFETIFLPTDSDIAQGISDFGQRLSWNYVGRTWFADASPGMGYLHTPISLLDSTQATKLNTKLARSQFTDNKPTDPSYPIQNAGLTPLEGTLKTAQNYFTSPATLPANQGGAQADLPQSCNKNFVVMLTDGLPSTSAAGVAVTNVSDALTKVATAAEDLLNSSAKVETYLIGFALPYGTDPATLDTIAAAGGTSTAYSAEDLATLNTSLDKIFSDILDKTGSAASVATNSTNLQNESRVYQAKFAASDWSGQVLQYTVKDLTTPEWDAGQKINSQTPGSRVILTKGTSDGVAFQWSNLTTSNQDLLDINPTTNADDNKGSLRVDYLRGDASQEGAAADKFRARSKSKLGDIVSSNPWYVGPPSAGYADADYPGYAAFRKAALTRKPVVYVGGNDGMLHGFDASLSTTPVDLDPLVDSDNDSDPTNDADFYPPATDAGKEVLAYVPTATYPHLSKLTGQTYNSGTNHRYFVDGSPMVADAYFNASWHTTLVGSMGAGGRGLFALDITDPDAFAESGTTPADILLWEFDQTNPVDGDIGYIYNNPPAHGNGQAKQIVKLANGKWAVLVGNGLNSDVGKAVLYVLYIKEGADDGTWDTGDYIKITADIPTSQNNGLSTPTPFDSNGDGFVDTVYAGDIKGNLWKFLIGPNIFDGSVTSNSTTWKLAFSSATCTDDCVPLFKATNDSATAQPITWPPEVSLHPDGGLVVLFGTGKYIESSDNLNTDVQSFYSVRDTGVAVGNRAVLSEKIIGTVTVDSNTYRTLSVGCDSDPLTVDIPDCPVPSKGCFVDLPTERERVTGIPKLISGTTFFNTFIPTAGACASGGTGWLMAMDYLTCGLPAKKLFDTDVDGDIDDSDTLIAGMQIGGALGGTTLISSTKPGEPGLGVSSLVTGELVTNPIALSGFSRGRVSWKELVQ